MNPRDYARAALRDRRAMGQLIDRQVLAPVRRAYAASTGGMAARLTRLGGFVPTAHSPLTALGRVRADQAARAALLEGGQRVGRTLVAAVPRAALLGAEGIARFARDAELGALRDTDVTAAAERVAQRMAVRRAQVAARTMARTVDAALTQAAGAPGTASVGDYHQQLVAAADAQQWQVDRLVRTETALVVNAARVEMMEELQLRVPGLYMRWTELVDEATGTPLDNRVGVDSLVLHGQVARPGGEFTLIADDRLPNRAPVGASWAQPPNRPNDRAVLTPWVRGMSVRGWVARDGERVYL